MPKFRSRPSSRRKPKLTASWLVTGLTISNKIKYENRTAHILPVRSSDHRKRYSEGQRLAVKAFVGGPTECHVHILSVDRLQVRDVDYPTCRALGFIRLDEFWEEWPKPHQWVWVLRFAVDRAETPRLLALRSDELYVENAAMALPGEPEALSEEDWRRHVEANRDLSHEQWVALGRMTRLERKRRPPKHLRRAA